MGADKSSDEIEIRFPLEFFLEGVPLALGASSRSRERWKARVAEAVRSKLQAGCWAVEGPIAVTIFYFPSGPMQGDLDNIVKPILDAMTALVYLDDRQVERLLVRKFEPHRPFSFTLRAKCSLKHCRYKDRFYIFESMMIVAERGCLVLNAKLRERMRFLLILLVNYCHRF